MESEVECAPVPTDKLLLTSFTPTPTAPQGASPPAVAPRSPRVAFRAVLSAAELLWEEQARGGFCDVDGEV